MYAIRYKDFFDDNFDLLNEKLALYETKVTPEMEQQIVDLYNSGIGSPEIARKLKISRNTVMRVLEKYNIKIRNFSKLTPEIEKQIVDLYKSGESARKIGNRLQVSHGTVLNTLKKHNIPRRESKVTPEMEKQIIDLYKSGEISSNQIAREFELTNKTVLRVLKKHNVPINSRSDAGALGHTNRYKDLLRQYHSTRYITGPGTPDNV